MSWFARERRGITNWRDRTLDSISAPPLPLVGFFGLFIMLMYFTTYSEYKESVERSRMGFRFLLLVLPLIVILVVLGRRWWLYATGVPRTVCDAVAEDGGPPWGLVLVVVLVLVMVHYHSSSSNTSWFSPI